MHFCNVIAGSVAIEFDEWDTGEIRVGETIDGANRIILGVLNGDQINTIVGHHGAIHGVKILVRKVKVHLEIFPIIISICFTLALGSNSNSILNSNGNYFLDYLARL